MPSSSVSWSTKQENMTSPLKFRTPPMVRSFDGNNNFGSAQRPKIENSGSRCGEVNLPCDDCGMQKANLILRWCETCGSAICDACILDRHPLHSITWYQEAVRTANRKFDEVLEACDCDMNQLRTERVKSVHFQHEIAAKIHEIKVKVARREKESSEMHGIMTRHWNEMARLAEVVVNAKTICERRHSALTAVTVAKSLRMRQEAIIKQLKSVDDVVSEMANECLGRTMLETADEIGEEEFGGNE